MLTNAVRCLQVARSLEDSPDVIVAPSVPLGTAWAGSKIAESRNAAFIFEVRDVWPQALVDDGGLSKRSPVFHAFRYLEKAMYRKAERISAAMPFLFNHVAESGGDRNKVAWVPNGVALERFDGCSTYDGGVERKLRVMYVGGFGIAHDVSTIVKAAAILQAESPNNFEFVVVGNGPKKSACIAEAETYGLRNLEFRDSVDKASIAQLQTQADVLVAALTNSAAYRFGLNLNKLVDYFASARPVVFAGTAANDPVRESGGGISIDPERPELMADALRRMLAMTPAERQEMGLRGRRYVEVNFEMSVLGKKMESLMMAAIADRKRKSKSLKSAEQAIDSSQPSQSSN